VTTKKIFLDANIFNDIYNKDRGTHTSSLASYKFALQNNFSVYTSCDIITNIYYITAKHTSKSNALEALDILKDVVSIIPFSTNELEQTIKLMQEDKDYNDMEDTIQYVLAKEEKCDLIITNDKKFVSKEITALSSEQFCKQHNIGY